MFSQLPQELQTLVIEFISPPKWKKSMADMIEWGKNFIACRNVQNVNIEWGFYTPSHRDGPNLNQNWEVQGSLTIARAENTFMFTLELYFEHWHVLRPISHNITAYESNPQEVELLFDLLNFCPREIKQLPNKHVVCPTHYCIGTSEQGPRSHFLDLILTGQRADFGDFLTYRQSGVETGPWQLLDLIL